jgi:hypothetical protein
MRTSIELTVRNSRRGVYARNKQREIAVGADYAADSAPSANRYYVETTLMTPRG